MACTVRDLWRERELAGKTRAGSYARSQARDRQRRFVRGHATRLLIGWLIIVSAAPITWFLVPSEFGRGLLVGGVLATATATVWHWIVTATGSAPLMMGDQAEQWTAEQVRKLGPGWMLINHFALSRGDIDHVILGPPGLLVLETKWSAQHWDSAEGSRRMEAAAEQVARSAKRMRHWHDLKQLKLPVTPVVVLWGDGAQGLVGADGVRRAKDAMVVAGPALRDWLRSAGSPGAGGDDSVQAAWLKLEAHARRRDVHDDLRMTRLPEYMLISLAAHVALALSGFMLVAMAAARWPVIGWLVVGVASMALCFLALRRPALRSWGLALGGGTAFALAFGLAHLARAMLSH